MGKELIGSSIMALAGFLLMISIEGKVLDNFIRIAFLFTSIFVFYAGMKAYHKYMPKQSLSSDDWIVIIFSILTPFIVVSSLNSLGMVFGSLAIGIWMVFAILVIFEKDKIADILLPKIEEKPMDQEFEKIMKRYPLPSKKKKKT